MAEFVYKGRSASGEVIKGKLIGASVDAVASRLTSLGITPVEIKDATVSDDILAGDIFRYFSFTIKVRSPTLNPGIIDSAGVEAAQLTTR